SRRLHRHHHDRGERSAGLTCVGTDSRGGGVYVCSNNRILRINVQTGEKTVIAGTGIGGFSGDGGPALVAQPSSPSAVSADAGGNLYVADIGNRRIRRITATSGQISTAVAPEVGISGPLCLDAAGNLFMQGNGGIVKIAPDSGLVSKVAGGGDRATIGDG